MSISDHACKTSEMKTPADLAQKETTLIINHIKEKKSSFLRAIPIPDHFITNTPATKFYIAKALTTLISCNAEIMKQY